jgi:hypothetical protein
MIDAVVSRTIDAGRDYTLGLNLRGGVVNVTLDGQALLSHAFNAVTMDGRFGLLVQSGSASYDTVTVKTDDAAVGAAVAAGNLTASAAVEPMARTGLSQLTEADLAPIVVEAKRRWVMSGALDAAARARLDQIEVRLADFGGSTLGQTSGNTITLDRDAAGYGWFLDATPDRDEEFRRGGEVLEARTRSNAADRMDLLSAVSHEIGHALGLEHAVLAGDVMEGTLALGERSAPLSGFWQAAPVVARSAGSQWKAEFVTALAGSGSDPNRDLVFDLGGRASQDRLGSRALVR